MARSDLLVSLVRAGAAGDRREVAAAVEAIVAEERAKQHNILADRLTRALRSNGNGSRAGYAAPEPAARVRDYGAAPPGLAGRPSRKREDIAGRSARGGACGPVLHRSLRRHYARTTPCVLFFDEFNAVGKERGDVNETGEIKRVVTSLPMQVDDLPSYTVVAASNHSELLDRAVWRRFQVRLELPTPTQAQLTRYFDAFARKMDRPLGRSADSIARSLGDVSYAEAEEFCCDVRRRLALSPAEGSLRAAVAGRLALWEGESPSTGSCLTRRDGLSSPAAAVIGAGQAAEAAAIPPTPGATPRSRVRAPPNGSDFRRGSV